MRNQMITLVGMVCLLLSSYAYSQSPCEAVPYNPVNIYGLCAELNLACFNGQVGVGAAPIRFSTHPKPHALPCVWGF